MSHKFQATNAFFYHAQIGMHSCYFESSYMIIRGNNSKSNNSQMILFQDLDKFAKRAMSKQSRQLIFSNLDPIGTSRLYQKYNRCFLFGLYFIKYWDLASKRKRQSGVISQIRKLQKTLGFFTIANCSAHWTLRYTRDY